MSQLDLRIRGARVVDGTGSAPVVADVGVKDGRIAFVGETLHSSTQLAGEHLGLLEPDAD